MSLYVQDNETNTVRLYLTAPSVEKAIEILLQQDRDLIYEETHPGYVLKIVEDGEGERN